MDLNEYLIDIFYEFEKILKSRDKDETNFPTAEYHLDFVGEILNDLVSNTKFGLLEHTDLQKVLTEAIKEFISISQLISDPIPSSYKEKEIEYINQIEERAKNLFDDIVFPDQNSKYAAFLSLAVNNKLKNINLDSASALIEEIQKERNKANQLTREIEDRSRSKFAHDYSNIFHHEAKSHSRITLKSKENTSFGLGYAQFYFLLGILFIGILVWLINTDYFIPNPNLIKNDLLSIQELGISSVSYSQVLIPFYLKKVLILALIFFGIRFSFKQFAIHKHLHTVNQHRANTLDSFDFFHKNLKDSDADSRDQYLIEVAKSIFNMSDTGFIKNDSKESISFIDNFKFFKEQN